MVNDSHTERVESHQAQHRPVEGVRLHHAADGDAKEAFLAAEIHRWSSPAAPEAFSGHGDALRGGRKEWRCPAAQFEMRTVT